MVLGHLGSDRCKNHFSPFLLFQCVLPSLGSGGLFQGSSESFLKPKAAKSKSKKSKAFKVQKTFAHENTLNVHVMVSYQIMKRTLQRLKCCIRERKQHESGVWEI